MFDAPLRARWRAAHLRPLTGVALAVLGGATLADCGSSTSSAPSTTTTVPLTGFAAQPAQVILAAACGATLPVHSVAVASTFSRPTLVGGLSSMSWTMTTAANRGSLRYTDKAVVSVVVVPTTTYIKAPAAWWSTTSAAGATAALANKWISISSASASASIATPLIFVSNLQATLANCTAAGRLLAKGSLGEVGGSQTIDVIVTGGFTTQRLSVPTREIPYVVKSVFISAQVGTETSVLSGFGTQRAVLIPAGAVPIEAPGPPLS